jgi:Ni,Fe-hydrogenase III large subunit
MTTSTAHRLPDELQTEEVPAVAWQQRAATALVDGWRFASLHGTRGLDGSAQLHAAFTREGRILLMHARSHDARFPSLLATIPAAQWDEREAHDLHGISFDGHKPLRPLIESPAALSDWTTSVHGRDPYQVAVGPIHAGIIESGHFRFHVVGERILHLDLQLFYKHRGLERGAEGKPAPHALAYAQRACGACAVTNSLAFAHAYEQALGLWPSAWLRRARTLLLELERLYNHLNDIAAICAGVGFAAGNMAFAALKERAHRVNAQLTGHRFLFNTITLGHSNLTISQSAAQHAAAELAAIDRELTTAWRQLQFSHSVQERLRDVGTLSRHDAERIGAVGPAARASGVPDDVRTDSPRLWYEGFEPDRPPQPTGDVAARLEIRGAELRTTFRLLADLLSQAIDPSGAVPAASHTSLGVGRVESPRGATLCVLELGGDDHVERMHLRTGSYANWPALAHTVPGNLLPDFPLINKSFELCYACTDR